MDHLPVVGNAPGVAGVIMLWSDDRENFDDGRLELFGTNNDAMTSAVPMASFTANAPNTNSGGPMLREIMSGAAVTMFWPGTGPIDPVERSALKDLFTFGITGPWVIPSWYGPSGSSWTREEFLLDDSIDPCGGSSNQTHKRKRLAGVHCEGGHVVSLQLGAGNVGAYPLKSLPESVGAFGHLRSFWYTSGAPAAGTVDKENTISIPSSVGNWTELLSFIVCGDLGAASEQLALPDAVSNWHKLTWLEVDSIGISGIFPSLALALPSLEVVRTNKIPIQQLPEVSSMKRLKIFSLVAANLRGPLPSFRGLSKLLLVSLGENKLTGGGGTYFDDCNALMEINIKSNSLQCPVFNFSRCNALKKIELANNQVTASSQLVII
jgi:hypothetical protein